MSHEPQTTDADLLNIDRYLAGALSAADCADFEQRLSQHPALAAELELQRRLDARLRSAYPLPPHSLAHAQLEFANNSAPRPSPDAAVRYRASHRTLLFAAAAAALLALAVTSTLWLSRTQRAGTGDTDTPFAVALAGGFVPTIRETDPAALEALIAEKLGANITLRRSASISYMGLRTDGGQSPVGFAIVAQVGGRPSLLQLDHRQPRGGAATVPGKVNTTSPNPGLYRHEQAVGGLALTEWSQSPTALLLPAGGG